MHVSRLLFLLFTLVPSSLSSKQQEDFLLLVKYEDGTREFARRVLRILPQTVENLRRLARLDIHLRTVDCEDTKPAIECHRLDLLSSAVVLFPDTPSTGPTLEGHVYETDLSDAEIEKAFLEIASERFHEDLLMFHSWGSEGAASKGERPESTVVLFPLLDLDPSIELEGEEVLKEFIAKSTRKDVSFVLYWLSVDIPSRNLALAQSNISKAHPELRIGTVACHEHPLSCDSRGVTEFPLLRAYRKGALYKVFHGLPSQTALSEWMRMLNQPEIYQVKQETMASFREGYVPGFPGEVRRAVTVGFFTSKDTKEYKDFERVSTLLHGRYHLSALVDKEISKWAHNPALATFRPFEPVSKADALHKDMSVEAMKDFVVASSSPSVLNLTSPLLFSEISRRGLPLVVLLHEDSSTLLHEVAVDIDRRLQVTFASLNNTMSEFGQKLLRKWKIRRSLLPVVILLDTEKGALFLHDVHKDSTKDDVWNWVTKTLKKPGEPHVLLPRYEESMASTLGQEDQLLRTEGRASEPAAKLVLPEGSLPVPGVASHFLKEEL